MASVSRFLVSSGHIKCSKCRDMADKGPKDLAEDMVEKGPEDLETCVGCQSRRKEAQVSRVWISQFLLNTLVTPL